MLLVFGNEVHGVSQEAVALCTGIEIPQLGTKHSLNISVVHRCRDLFKQFQY
jgi:tRNA G18 (ribose-2'-O)-methylase SpoU